MRLQSISTATESAGLDAIRHTLSGTEWLIAPRISIQSVLTKEEWLSDDAFSLFTQGHFDCVVYREENSEPIFAVEFDGWGHDKQRQVKRDRLKNLFCVAVGLPLLRLGVMELMPRDHISVLEWLIQAFVAFERQEAEELLDEGPDVEERGSDESADEPDPLDEADAGFVLDEDGPIFEGEHPFPANAAITERLLRNYGISVGTPLAEKSALGRIVMDSSSGTSPYVLNVRWPGHSRFEESLASEFVVSERDFSVHDRTELLYAGTGRGRFAWAHRLPEHAVLDSVADNGLLTAEQIRFRIEQRLSPLDLDWLEASGVARELALYDALSHVERWAERRPITGHA